MTTRVMNTFTCVAMTSPVPLEDIVQSQHFPQTTVFGRLNSTWHLRAS